MTDSPPRVEQEKKCGQQLADLLRCGLLEGHNGRCHDTTVDLDFPDWPDARTATGRLFGDITP